MAPYLSVGRRLQAGRPAGGYSVEYEGYGPTVITAVLLLVLPLLSVTS